MPEQGKKRGKSDPNVPEKAGISPISGMDSMIIICRPKRRPRGGASNPMAAYLPADSTDALIPTALVCIIYIMGR